MKLWIIRTTWTLAVVIAVVNLVQLLGSWNDLKSTDKDDYLPTGIKTASSSPLNYFDENISAGFQLIGSHENGSSATTAITNTSLGVEPIGVEKASNASIELHALEERDDNANKSVTPKLDTNETSSNHPLRVRFVPFPHNNLGFGSDVSCNWTVIDYRNTNDPMLQSLLGSSQDSTSIQAPPDSIQKGALKDGICIPRNKTAASKLHLFSTQDAKACLYNVTLFISGDSYNIQLSIGLVDILTSSRSTHEIIGREQRREIQKKEFMVGLYIICIPIPEVSVLLFYHCACLTTRNNVLCLLSTSETEKHGWS
jgi:hypothetical protein